MVSSMKKLDSVSNLKVGDIIIIKSATALDPHTAKSAFLMKSGANSNKPFTILFFTADSICSQCGTSYEYDIDFINQYISKSLWIVYKLGNIGVFRDIHEILLKEGEIK